MKLTIFARLALGYLLLVLLVFSIGAFSRYQLDSVREKTGSMIRNDTLLLEVQKKLLDSLLSGERNEEKYVLLHDPALLEEYRKAEAAFVKHLKEAGAISTYQDLRELLKKIETYHKQYSETFKEELGFIIRKEEYPRDEYKERKEKIISGILTLLNEFKTLSREHIIETLKEIGSEEERAEKMVTFLTIAAIVFGIILSVVITRSILRPLSQIRKKTVEIAEGRIESDLHVSGPPEIGALSESFNQMCQRLRELDNLKADFFSTMSHELRTPLTTIREGTSLLKENTAEVLDARQRRILEIISEESRRLIDLVNNLLDLSRMEAGMLTYNFSRANLILLARQVIKEIEPLAESRNIQVKEEFQDIPEVEVDQERILQAIRNLLSNALKFTPSSGVVRVTAERKNGEIIFSVSDQGPGIPEEYRERIFDKYQQAALPEVKLYKGTGLGLAIVKKIIEAHGGKVWVEPEQERGSRFCFSLPG